MKDVEVVLLESLDYFKDSYIYHPVEYALMAGGKRLRPRILSLVGDIYRAPEEDLEVLMMALEWIHNYSLIHDDLPGMDDDNFRRGQLTLHKKFDEATAILAGDALLNGASELILRHSLSLEGARLKNFLQAGYLLLKAAGSHGMIQGQMVDLHPSLDQEDYMKKTNELFYAAFMIPLVLVEADGQERGDMELCGRSFGNLFQHKDDLDDQELDHYNKKDLVILREVMDKALERLESKRPEIKQLRKFIQEALYG